MFQDFPKEYNVNCSIRNGVEGTRNITSLLDSVTIDEKRVNKRSIEETTQAQKYYAELKESRKTRRLILDQMKRKAKDLPSKNENNETVDLFHLQVKPAKNDDKNDEGSNTNVASSKKRSFTDSTKDRFFSNPERSKGPLSRSSSINSIKYQDERVVKQTGTGISRTEGKISLRHMDIIMDNGDFLSCEQPGNILFFELLSDVKKKEKFRIEKNTSVVKVASDVINKLRWLGGRFLHMNKDHDGSPNYGEVHMSIVRKRTEHRIESLLLENRTTFGTSSSLNNCMLNQGRMHMIQGLSNPLESNNIVYRIHHMDVIMIDGSFLYRHPGNIFFLEFLLDMKTQKDLVLETKVESIVAKASKIIERIALLGGRFLEKKGHSFEVVKETSLWKTIGEYLLS